jgi:hypothetical protein
VCTHQLCHILKHFHHLKRKPYAIKQLTSSQPQQPPIYFLTLWIYLFLIFHINEVIQYLTFCIWLFLLSMFLRFFHIVTCINSSFLWLNKIPLYGYTLVLLNLHFQFPRFQLPFSSTQKILDEKFQKKTIRKF